MAMRHENKTRERWRGKQKKKNVLQKYIKFLVQLTSSARLKLTANNLHIFILFRFIEEEKVSVKKKIVTSPYWHPFKGI